MLALWSMEIIDEQIKVKGKTVEQFYWQPLGQENGKTYPISTATKAILSI